MKYGEESRSSVAGKKIVKTYHINNEETTTEQSVV